MPGLLAHTIPIWYLALAYLAVALFKAGACIVYGVVLKRWLNDVEVNVVVLGTSRTLLGMLLGSMCLGWSWCVHAEGAYWGQAPMRIILWWFIIWRFFCPTNSVVQAPRGASADSSFSPGSERALAWRRPVAILVGIAVSYLTDIPLAGSLYVY